jgi:hypothetical protein
MSPGSVNWHSGGMSDPIDVTASCDPVWIPDCDGESALVTNEIEGPRLEGGFRHREMGWDLLVVPSYEANAPRAIVIRYLNREELSKALASADAAPTFGVFTSTSDNDASWLIELGQTKAGRVIANGFPTGAGVSWSTQHGDPRPPTTASSATSVGANGIDRWLRPVTYQGVPEDLLPEALRDSNPLDVPQRVDGTLR